MHYSLRTLLIGQFGLRALFALTTMAAIAFAIIRLPILSEFKLIAMIVVWGIFRVWLQTTRKQPATPASRVNDAVLEIVGQTIWPVFIALGILNSPLGHTVTGFVLIGFCVLIPAFVILRAIMVTRSELKRTSAVKP